MDRRRPLGPRRGFARRELMTVEARHTRWLGPCLGRFFFNLLPQSAGGVTGRHFIEHGRHARLSRRQRGTGTLYVGQRLGLFRAGFGGVLPSSIGQVPFRYAAGGAFTRRRQPPGTIVETARSPIAGPAQSGTIERVEVMNGGVQRRVGT